MNAGSLEVAMSAATPITPEELGELLDEAMSVRELLATALKELTASGVIPASRVDELERSLGRRGLAVDVALLVRIFREHWPAIEPKRALSSRDLGEFERSSRRLGEALAARARGDRSKRPAPRKRPLSLLVRARVRARRVLSSAR